MFGFGVTLTAPLQSRSLDDEAGEKLPDVAILDAKIAEAEQAMKDGETSSARRLAKDRREDMMRLKRVEQIYVCPPGASAVLPIDFAPRRAPCYPCSPDGCLFYLSYSWQRCPQAMGLSHRMQPRDFRQASFPVSNQHRLLPGLLRIADGSRSTRPVPAQTCHIGRDRCGPASRDYIEGSVRYPPPDLEVVQDVP